MTGAGRQNHNAVEVIVMMTQATVIIMTESSNNIHASTLLYFVYYHIGGNYEAHYEALAIVIMCVSAIGINVNRTALRTINRHDARSQ